jgi:hypothetical protein
MTDAEGRYALAGLPAGTYTLTPSKQGWAFTQASRTVTVPPDRSGQNFTALDVSPPGGSLASPADGARIGPGTLRIAANAWDNPGGSGVYRVEFYATYDGATSRIGYDSVAPYAIDWQTPASLRSQQIALRIEVVDRAGNLTKSPGGARTLSYVESLGPGVDENWVPGRAYLNQRYLPNRESGAGAASTAMVLAMNDLNPADVGTLAAIANSVYPNTVQGNQVWLSKMVYELNRHGADAAYHAHALADAWARLRQEVDAGHPLIVRTAPGGVVSEGHFIVAVGYRQTASSRQVIAYDPYGRWTGELNRYDRNTTDPGSRKGAWVFYDFDAVFGGWLITARRADDQAGLLAPTEIPNGPPDAVSGEPRAIGMYSGVRIGAESHLFLTLISNRR